MRFPLEHSLGLGGLNRTPPERVDARGSVGEEIETTRLVDRSNGIQASRVLQVEKDRLLRRHSVDGQDDRTGGRTESGDLDGANFTKRNLHSRPVPNLLSD